jgi:hypothetical protein
MFGFIKNRSLRTVFLAIFAAATFAGSAIFIFDVDPHLMLQLFIVCILGVGGLMLLALCFTGLRIFLSRWLKR